MLIYRASLDVAAELATHLSALLHAHRRQRGTRCRRRVLTCRAQAVLVLRWFRQRAAVADLACDNEISLSSAYRYLHEAIGVLAAHAPDLPDVIEQALAAGTEYLLLDGTLIPTDRVRDSTRAHDRWYSGKHRHHGGNVQVVCDPDGYPLWTSSVEPGSVHDLTAARVHALPALYAAAARGLPTLADKGYTGTGAGIHVPIRRPTAGQRLDPATRGWNSYINSHRAFVEHGIGHLKTRWRALRHISLDPGRIGAITAAALILTHAENRY